MLVFILLVVIIFLIFCFLLFRFYQIYHLSFSSEKNSHFPQWSKTGIITRDNYLLHLKGNFVPNSKYIIIGIHGMGASKEDFNYVSKYFNNHAFSFISFDQRGWGENSYWRYRSLGTTVQDIFDVITVVKEKYPNQKIILMGESLGAALAPLAAKQDKNKVIDGIIVGNFVTKKKLFKLNSSLISKATVGFLFNKNINLPIKLAYSEISDNPEYIKLANNRALKNMSFTLTFALQAKKISNQVLKNVNEAKTLTLVTQTGQDAFADLTKVKANEDKWQDNVTYKFYQTGQHAFLNDKIINQVLVDINAWINNIS